MKKLPARFENLHNILVESENINIIDFKTGFLKLDIEKFLQQMESKNGSVIPTELHEAIVSTYENSMTYHCYVDGKLKFEGGWGFLSLLDSFFENPWLTHKFEDKETSLIVFDRPNVAMQFGCFKQSSNIGDIGNVLFYKRGQIVETSLSLKEYVENMESFMGVFYWPLLFAINEKDVSPFIYEKNKLKDAYKALRLVFPDRDLSVFSNKLIEKGLM